MEKHSANHFFCRVSNLTLGKPFDECAIKNTRQIAVCRLCRCRVLFTECYTRQSLCRMFFGLCQVPVTHGKVTISSSVAHPFHFYFSNYTRVLYVPCMSGTHNPCSYKLEQLASSNDRYGVRFQDV